MFSKFLNIDETTLLRMIKPPKDKVDIVIDTDAFNEIDDQFALTYAFLSPEKINVKACYAVPFFNENSNGPGHGMELSYQEIFKVLDRLDMINLAPVFKGATSYLVDYETHSNSPAVEDLIERSFDYDSENPLYVVCIGALTNIASAIIKCPEIVNRIVIIWLGGQPYNWHIASEYNLNQDFVASKLLFNISLPFVHIPCKTISEKLSVTVNEIKDNVKRRGRIGDYLFSIFEKHMRVHSLTSKPIWDISNIAYLVNDRWVPTVETLKPGLDEEEIWKTTTMNYLCRVAIDVRRDCIFKDFFTKLNAFSATPSIKVIEAKEGGKLKENIYNETI